MPVSNVDGVAKHLEQAVSHLGRDVVARVTVDATAASRISAVGEADSARLALKGELLEVMWAPADPVRAHHEYVAARWARIAEQHPDTVDDSRLLPPVSN